jgi:hypothetical protein
MVLAGEATVKNPSVRLYEKKPMSTYVVKFDEGTMRVQAKNEAEALSILAEWFECSPTVLLEGI